MKAALKRLAEGLAELVYPSRAECMGCGSRVGMPRSWLCEECRVALASRWAGPGHAPEGGLFDGAAYGYKYGGPAAGMVRNLKYRGVRKLSEGMGRAMAQAFEGLGNVGAELLVPVPMHPKRLRQRGFNHAAVLAERTGTGLGLPAAEALARVRNTRQQARLTGEERRRNMDGAFEVVGDVRGRRVVLVDDVCTTGSTANACAKALREGGAAAVYLLCYAVAEPDSQEPDA